MTTIETAGRATTVVPERDVTPHRRSRPPSQYWDHRTASWRTHSPVPVPRRGD